jgi:hypothetical protein
MEKTAIPESEAAIQYLSRIIFIRFPDKKRTIVTGQKSRICCGFESALKFFLILFLPRKDISSLFPLCTHRAVFLFCPIG